MLHVVFCRLSAMTASRPSPGQHGTSGRYQVRGYFLVFVSTIEKYGIFIARCNVLIEKVSPFTDCNRPGDPVGRHYIGRHSAQRGDPLRLRENAESPQKADAVQRRLEQGWDSSTSLAWSRPGEHFVGRHAVRPATDCPQYVLANKRNQSVGTTRKSGHKSASKRRRHRRDTTQSLSMPAVEQVVAATGSGCGELLGEEPRDTLPAWIPFLHGYPSVLPPITVAFCRSIRAENLETCRTIATVGTAVDDVW
eukprot:SAG31_NODE_2664_length_5277_cov_461.678943_6_plen_251_part_00